MIIPCQCEAITDNAPTALAHLEQQFAVFRRSEYACLDTLNHILINHALDTALRHRIKLP